VSEDAANTGLRWFLHDVLPQIPGRLWTSANTVFWPRSDNDTPHVGRRSGALDRDHGTDAHVAIPFDLFLLDMPVYLVIGDVIVKSLVLPQGLATSPPKSVTNGAYQRQRKLHDPRLLQLPPVAGPSTSQMLTDFTIMYADDTRSALPVLRADWDNGASEQRAELLLCELYDPEPPITGEPLYTAPIVVERETVEDPFLGAQVRSHAGLLYAAHIVPDADALIADLTPPNFRIVPFASFKHNAARNGYILGFLAYAESLCTFTPHLALSILTIFVDFTVRGWPPRLTYDAIRTRAQRSRTLPRAYDSALEVLLPFRNIRRAYRLPPRPLEVFLETLLSRL
jgi:hypothetical protein